MVQGRQWLLPLSTGLLVAVAISGCLGDLMAETTCPFTATAASWTQPGLFDNFTAQGAVGAYNVTLREGDGIPLQETERGDLILSRVEWTPEAEETNQTPLLFRLDADGRLSVTAPESVDRDALKETFLEFVRQVTELGDQEAGDRWDDLLRHQIHTQGSPVLEGDGDAGEASQETEAQTGDERYVEYDLMLQGPFRFDALWEQRLTAEGVDEQLDPWQEEYVELGAWRFHFPTPTRVAEHTMEEGRSFEVDALDRARFQWDPPVSAGEEAVLAGIQRTMDDLDLPLPPLETPAVEIHHSRTC